MDMVTAKALRLFLYREPLQQQLFTYDLVLQLPEAYRAPLAIPVLDPPPKTLALQELVLSGQFPRHIIQL